ncbi:glycoside hydrolase family 95 protein [Parabacteroides faecis]|uniref:glycoside hydrolase family 95 protein n=1 Tax=Parabacteroides faecis TaxID=1217282 RepID=UPI002165F2F4|nr:glycoside hydrolase family 95 protein [Parabacteroides faecis]MCS2893784.1 glycoside hydrolase family 95 protein [Parabacteroides faecis]
MRNTFAKVVWCLVPTTLLACAGDAPPAKQTSSTILYMDKPAASWYEATPIGNGRLGGNGVWRGYPGYYPNKR